MIQRNGEVVIQILPNVRQITIQLPDFPFQKTIYLERQKASLSAWERDGYGQGLLLKEWNGLSKAWQMFFISL